MSQAFPNRREELDMYEANIIDIFNVYGDRFYEYHKLFSLKSASALAIHKIKVDWSVRDRDLIQLIASRARSCSICSEVSHNTKFCPSFQKSDVTPTTWQKKNFIQLSRDLQQFLILQDSATVATRLYPMQRQRPLSRHMHPIKQNQTQKLNSALQHPKRRY